MATTTSTHSEALRLAASCRTNAQIEAWKSAREDRPLVIQDALSLRAEWADEQ